jgi:SAM-dependent methyltransferase
MPVDPKAIDGRVEPARFSGLTYEHFRSMAGDPTLSANEKIGMPDSARLGFDASILVDILHKVPPLTRRGQTVVDIGSGCGTFAHRFIAYCSEMEHRLLLVDSPEMLAHLPHPANVNKATGRFPANEALIKDHVPDGADVVLVYGVLSVVFVDSNPFHFVDRAAALLRNGGHLLVGDVPNASKLRRFLASDAGACYHKDYMRTEEPPAIGAFDPPNERIDDGVVLGIVDRMRRRGYDAYIVPQSESLPLSNRREDILIVRP